MPELWKENLNKWKSTHQNFEIILWDDNSSIELLNQYFPEYVKLYNSFKYPIQRADFIRYCILYVYGGIYCDLDIIPKKNHNIEQLLNIYEPESNLQVLLSSSTMNSVPTNSFMVSKPRSQFWIDTMDEIKNRSDDYYMTKTTQVLKQSGPHLLLTIYNNYKKSDNLQNTVELIPSNILNSCDICGKCDNTFGILEDQHAKSWNDDTTSIMNNAYCVVRDYKNTSYYNWMIIISILVIILLIILFMCIKYINLYNQCSQKLSTSYF